MHTTPTTTQAAAEISGDGRDHLLTALHEDETGAQAMEYAALAGGGATIVGILVSLLQSDRVQDRIAAFITSMLDSLGGTLGGLL